MRCCCSLAEGSDDPLTHGWDEVGWRVKWGWCGPACCQRGGGQPREWILWRKGVEIDLLWGQVDEVWTVGALPGIEQPGHCPGRLGWRPHIPQSQIRGMSGTAKRWATVWSVEWQSGLVGSSAQPTGFVRLQPTDREWAAVSPGLVKCFRL